MTRTRTLATIALAFALLPIAAPAAQASEPAARCGRQVYQNGTVGPVVCPGGQVNAAVKNDMKKGAPSVMDLGRHATWPKIRRALCADAADSTFPMLTDAYQYQFTRYDWATSSLPLVGKKVVAVRGTFSWSSELM